MTTLKIEALTPTIGAEISGVELNGALDQATLDAVYDALIEHLVIFFRDQGITPEAQLRFAESFGEIDRPHHAPRHRSEGPAGGRDGGVARSGVGD